MIIYGAGMAGLLAGVMLRHHNPVIHECQPALPNNHAALLRFRSDAVARVTGIPFRRVRVEKAVMIDGQLTTCCDLRINNMYSLKVTGIAENRSILNLEPGERWIAPPDLIRQMATRCRIEYNSELTWDKLTQIKETIISTIPMPRLMKIVSWDDFEFPFQNITTFSGRITFPDVNLYQTIYYPAPETPWYRASITGNLLQLEFLGKHEAPVQAALAVTLVDFGLQNCSGALEDVRVSYQQYGKLTPVDDLARKPFIMAMTDRYNLYSLGRFATWRQILLDDVVQDIHWIDSCISQRDYYARRLNVTRGRW